MNPQRVGSFRVPTLLAVNFYITDERAHVRWPNWESPPSGIISGREEDDSRPLETSMPNLLEVPKSSLRRVNT
jgi:hypothetical protein